MASGNEDFIDIDWDFLDRDEPLNNDSSNHNSPVDSVVSDYSDSTNSMQADKTEKKQSQSTIQESRNEKNKKPEELFNASLKDIDEYWNYYLDKIDEILALEPLEFRSFINKVKMPLYGGKWNNYEKDRLRFFLAWMALSYSDTHYLEPEYFENREVYLEILDSIDKYIEDMKERTVEADYLFLVANLYSAHRYQNIDPIVKLNELWTEIQGTYLNDNITEFKSDYWKEKGYNIYQYMIAFLSEGAEDQGK